jgi:hypothetical protein
MLKTSIVTALVLAFTFAVPAAPAEAGILKRIARAVVLKTVVPAECKIRKALHESTGILCK